MGSNHNVEVVEDDDIGCLTQEDMEFMAKMFWFSLLFWCVIIGGIVLLVWKYLL